MAIQTVPNQRVVKVNKEKADKDHLYTVNNLKAIDEAVKYLQTKGGFKLYYYIAKNQNQREFALSSKDFCEWSGVGISAYNSAFEELKAKGFLIQQEGTGNRFMFYEKSRFDLAEQSGDKVIIEFPKEEQ